MLTRAIRDLGNFLFLKILTRWVAGDKAEDAIRYCGGLKCDGCHCIINYLGEHYTEVAPVLATVREYKRLIGLIQSPKTAISIKPSQFGFNVMERKDSEKFCQQQMLEVVRCASEKGVLVWLDMEDSRYTDFTLRFHRRFAGRYKLGICLQANLLRTEKDLLELIKLSKKADVRVRLVKGIYKEKDAALTDPHEIHVKFLSLIREAFEQSPKGFGIAVGSHHTQAIELALKLQEQHRKRFFEVQVLKGVLPGYYKELRKSGVHLAEYVPYGEDAFAYSIRRARKNPRFARSMIFAPLYDAYKKLYG